jgi:hypothetical protein
MNNLSKKMQERLEKWRKNTTPVASVSKIKGYPPSRRNGKNDYGDAMTLEEWDEEARKSQTRR